MAGFANLRAQLSRQELVTAVKLCNVPLAVPSEAAGLVWARLLRPAGLVLQSTVGNPTGD